MEGGFKKAEMIVSAFGFYHYNHHQVLNLALVATKSHLPIDPIVLQSVSSGIFHIISEGH